LRRIRTLIGAAILVVAAAGCHHGAQRAIRPTVDPQMLKLSKDDLWKRGEEQYNRRKFPSARTYFAFLYENYPNDPLGRRSLLRVADTYFAQGDAVNLVEAQYKYRDFINRYPGSENADYAMLQIANVAFKQMARADRDQAKTHEAVDKLNEMIVAYPHSKYRPEAEKHLQEAQDRLAGHELVIAEFYMKRKSFTAAVARLNGIVEHFPNYSQRAATFYDLGTSLEALGRKGEARLYYERVVTEFPASDFANKAKNRLDLPAVKA
jgi:outer membrane protein assembly factor BamD